MQTLYTFRITSSVVKALSLDDVKVRETIAPGLVDGFKPMRRGARIVATLDELDALATELRAETFEGFSPSLLTSICHQRMKLKQFIAERRAGKDLPDVHA